MHLLQSQNRIIELMSVFVAQVKGATAMTRTDLNRVAENILIPILAEVYGYRKLENLNLTEGLNYPGIDLGDKSARVAIQVTSTAGSDKIKTTLRKFVEYELHRDYDRLIVYILTDKQKSYSTDAFEEIIQGKFVFNADSDIWDYTDVLRVVSGFQVDRARRVQNILEANFGVGSTPLFLAVGERRPEIVYLNLLGLFFPPTLYVAEMDIGSKRSGRKRGKRSTGSGRDAAYKALTKLGLKFAVDWECYERKVITFHDLNDESLPLAKIIDKGTITPLSPEEFYGADENYERVFKSLLRRCLQQKLYLQRVLWQNQDDLFIFSDVKGEAIRVEQWHGKKENERTVYERVMKTNKPDEILNCKHFAFQVQFKRFDQRWYVLIKPEWFFSYDGYKRSFYGAERIAWLKRNEGNSHVFNHLRFMAHFLKNEPPPGLFEKRHVYPFLSFGELVSFGDAPALDDEAWRPARPADSDLPTDDSRQISLPLDL